ncbi:MAG: hypothetical protein ACOYW7_08440 [Nitrospirota bacterium]
MRYLRVALVLALTLLLGISAYAEPKNRKFTREEIKKMDDVPWFR